MLSVDPDVNPAWPIGVSGIVLRRALLNPLLPPGALFSCPDPTSRRLNPNELTGERGRGSLRSAQELEPAGGIGEHGAQRQETGGIQATGKRIQGVGEYLGDLRRLRACDTTREYLNDTDKPMNRRQISRGGHRESLRRTKRACERRLSLSVSDRGSSPFFQMPHFLNHSARFNYAHRA
jgi:hypothetical protein